MKALLVSALFGIPIAGIVLMIGLGIRDLRRFPDPPRPYDWERDE